MGVAIVSLLATLLFLVWFCQLVQLMLFSDEDFPGKNDKLIWCLIFILLSPIAPFAFMWWKTAYKHVRSLQD